MATRMLQRRGTAAEWAAQNPVLGDGEIGVERDSSIFKVGNGVDAWADLPPRFAPYVHTHSDKSDVGHVHDLTKVVRIPHTFTITGEVKVASGDTSFIPPFFVPVPVGQTAVLVGVRSVIKSGTSVTFDVLRDGFTVSTGWSGIVAATAPSDFAGTPTGWTDGQYLSMVVTAVSGTPKNLSVTVYVDYTF